MITIRRSNDRGHFNHGWLDTYHTFSFSDYQDRDHMRFRSLRVINEDRVAPGQGFGTHGHRDMEIVTYVLSGALEHRDSMGNGEILRPGEFQRMSAGTGIQHSEFNPAKDEPVHLYQIWLLPERKGLTPSYEQRAFNHEQRPNELVLVASPDGRDQALSIKQDAQIYLSKLTNDGNVQHKLATGRAAWLQVLRGSVTLNGDKLETSDGAAIEDVAELNIAATEPAEILLFDMA
jgi:quercetin 2,3-dioxygenase